MTEHLKGRLFATALLVGMFAFFALVIWLLPVDDAWARAGGGGSFGGGGGGGSGGGEGLGALIYILIRLIIEVPVIGIPLTIAIIAAFFFLGRKGSDKAVQGHRDRTIRKAYKGRTQQQMQKGLAQFRQRDPEFDVQRLAARIRIGFTKIQESWAAQDLRPMRAFVSDGLYERFSIQIDEQKDLGYRNVIEDLRIDGVNPAAAVAGSVFDELTFRIDASATDYRVTLDNGHEISGTRRPERFTEFWSLIRRPGAKMSSDKGLFEGQCPNCGASLEMNQSERCQSCDSLLRSGQYDWVLAEITQEAEWPSPDSSNAPGLAAYQKRDPGFSLQHIEDRTSVVFWRKVLSDRIGKIDPLQKVATRAFGEDYARDFKTKSNVRKYIGDCAVGAVETLGVLMDGDLDRVLVAVHWSGHEFETTPNGRGGGSPHMTAGASIRRHLFVLVRKAGLMTNVNHAVSSAHCPSCGAPEINLSAHACESCGREMGDDLDDWVLADILPLESFRAKGLLDKARVADSTQAPADAPSAAAGGGVAGPWIGDTFAGVRRKAADPLESALLAWVVKIAIANRQMDDRERKRIRKMAKAHHWTDEEIEALLASAAANDLETPSPKDRDEGRRWLTEMIDMALVDGGIDGAEWFLLAEAGEQFEYTKSDIRKLVKSRRKALYGVAKEVLKGRPGGSVPSTRGGT